MLLKEKQTILNLRLLSESTKYHISYILTHNLKTIYFLKIKCASLFLKC